MLQLKLVEAHLPLLAAFSEIILASLVLPITRQPFLVLASVEALVALVGLPSILLIKHLGTKMRRQTSIPIQKTPFSKKNDISSYWILVEILT